MKHKNQVDKYLSKMEKIKEKNAIKAQKEALKAERNKHRKKRKKISASKKVLGAMLVICAEIVIFTEVMIYRLGDTNSLYALIGIPVAIAPVIISYYTKSKAENTAGGIIYDTTMAQINQNGAEEGEG